MRLLLAEDDPRLGHELKERLLEAGYAVDWVQDGLAAEDLGTVEPYDAVVLDLGLPGRAGLEVLANWRARKLPLPVLVLTARDAWHEKVAGFQAGADDYLGKPFHVEELLARLQALIRRSSGQTGGILEVAGVRLDEQRQCALGDSGEIPLTGTEFRLLRYLMHHPGRILSKERLMEHVYDYDAEKESNVLEVYVNRLRRKLGPTLIETRRGQGYVFAPPGARRR
jgi:two-component system, OmpR family, response regulator